MLRAIFRKKFNNFSFDVITLICGMDNADRYFTVCQAALSLRIAQSIRSADADERLCCLARSGPASNHSDLD
jgi:hypothetical protein